MELKPGDIVGGVYRIDAEGPQGGMARIWRAWHRGLRTWHALKILEPEWTGNNEVWERFVAEGRIQAWHIHPHIVRVTDVVYDEHRTALVMDWIEGKDLEAILEDGPVEMAQAVTWIQQLLDALTLVHSHGVIHRDLKPANLLINEGGLLKLTDFGIARTEEGSGTLVGTRMGTPDYMSPEQLRDAAGVDARSDLYSVGAILFELLTGRIATREEGLPERIPDDVPAALAPVIQAAMQADPALRYPDAAAFDAALRAALAPPVAVVDEITEEVELPPPPPRRSRLGVALIALLALGLGGVGGAGVTWSMFGDPDGDGLGGEADQCPSRAEDPDDFEDLDGCPDPDNDDDGIADVSDACPDEAEDRDGRDDRDGCPDLDDDGDHIADAQDGCPTAAEDMDGFEDDDGCPEADNDNDGIVDEQDACPLRPEDGPGLFDGDGCPDPAVAVGSAHSCAMTAEGASLCWGSDDARARSLRGLTAITAASDHTCGLTDAGAARCVGGNTEGEAADQDGPFSWLDTAERATCGVLATGGISCWGSGPVMEGIPTATDFARLTVGKDHACAIHRGGSVTCWGSDSHDRLIAPSGEFLALSAGTWHTCGLRPGGEIACWGFDGNGQAVPPSGRFIALDSGRFHSCGVRSSGQLRCWGLGYNEPDADVQLPGGLVSVTLGAEHGCGLAGDGAVVCWGTDIAAARPPHTQGLLYAE